MTRRPQQLRVCCAVGMVLAVLLGAAPALGADDALPSRLATETLLLDVARAGGRLVAVGEWGHVVLSDDQGETWRQAASVPTRVTLTALDFVDAQRGWAVGHDAVVLYTRDGGETWQSQFSAPELESPLLSVWFENAERGIAVGAFGLVLETSDGGQSWRRHTLTGDPEEDPHLNGIFGGPDDSVFVSAEFGRIFRSRDRGQSWDRLEPGYEGSFWGGLSVEGGAILVFGMRGHIFRSEDLGESWERTPSDTEQSLQGGARLADGSLVLVGLAGTVLTSTDGGRSFEASTQPDRRGIAAVAEGRGGSLLLFGEAGIGRRTGVASRPSSPAPGRRDP